MISKFICKKSGRGLVIAIVTLYNISNFALLFQRTSFNQSKYNLNYEFYT